MVSGAQKWNRSDTGAAAVEFALLVPILMTLLFGIISYGYMLSFRQAMSQAAAEGSRAAAVAPAALTDAQVMTRALDAINHGLESYGVTCTASGTLTREGDAVGVCDISDPQSCTGSTTGALCVRVELSYAYRDNPLTPALPGVGFLLPETLAFETETQVS